MYKSLKDEWNNKEKKQNFPAKMTTFLTFNKKNTKENGASFWQWEQIQK